MSETVDTILEYAPYVGLGVGVAIGVAAESVLRPKVSAERKPLVELFDDITVEEEKKRLMRLRRVGATAFSVLAVGAGMTGLANGIVWQEDKSPEAKARFELIIDKSGASVLREQKGATPAEDINHIVTSFAGHEDTQPRVLVAQGGNVLEVGLAKANQIRPFGDAPMAKAVNNAFSNIEANTVNSGGKDATNSVLIVTNGNDFGRYQSVYRQAHRSDTSVFVKNVSKVTEPAKVKAMVEIAKATDGQYFGPEVKPNAVYEKAQAKATAKVRIENKPEEKDWKEKAFVGGLSVLALAIFIKARKNLPLTFNGTKLGGTE